MFDKILIANRGEIAVRIIRACKELGIETVAVCSNIDKDSLHVSLADSYICIGDKQAKDSYLNMESILSATIASGAQAIHPGFGFLSENAKFATMCEKCNIKFIGPNSDVITKMGDKSEARKTMQKAGVTVVPGSNEGIKDADKAKELADEIGYPVIIKASAGGGGRGMRIVKDESDFYSLFETAKLEAKNGFADDTMYIEKYINPSRHIEFQVLADNYGNVVHLGERECSIQRRHQKMIEEAPSEVISDELRQKMGAEAIKACKAANYTNAGTVEFILDEDNNYYFIEMNTRIQVEHGITECVTGVDLIKEQIKIAAGEPLDFSQEDVNINGHAIEVRINAENVERNFMPSPGRIEGLHFPGGNGVRVDSALYEGYDIPPIYDSLIAKIIVHASDRSEAIAKMKSALSELVIEGVDTNTDFQYEILSQEKFEDNIINTDFVEEMLKMAINQ